MPFRKRRSKKQYRDTEVSTKIEADHHIIDSANDPSRLARVIFPDPKAKMRRAAFLAIFFELRKAKGQRLHTLDHIPKKYGISQSTLCKARIKMKRLGLISESQGDYIFSKIFENSLSRLLDHLDALKRPPINDTERNMEYIFVEAAKSEDTLKQWRLKKKYKEER